MIYVVLYVILGIAFMALVEKSERKGRNTEKMEAICLKDAPLLFCFLSLWPLLMLVFCFMWMAEKLEGIGDTVLYDPNKKEVVDEDY